MSNEDGTIWISFNGEIYNFKELRTELIEAGHKFASDSDTETIVHAYEEYGVGCLQRLRGMFAFAIWDQKQQRLILARDRVGKKPLFYARADGQFVFASELQALVDHPGVRRDVDVTAIDDYLTYGYIPAPKTIYRNVYKLPPASYLLVSTGAGGRAAFEPIRYWNLEYEPKRDMSEDEAAEGLLDALTEAVRLRMVADVPLGALLSGGVDSSIVVALMSQLSDRPVKTFSIGFDDGQFNELPYARLVAKRYGTDHHEMIVRPDALEVLPTLVRHYGEPYADSSAIPSYYVSQLTRQHVTVALNGDGGDESLAGYERYWGSRLAEMYRRIPRLVRRSLIEPSFSIIPNTLNRRNRLRQAKRFLQSAGLNRGECYLRWLTILTPEQKCKLYSAGFQAELDGHDAQHWFLDLFNDSGEGEKGHLDSLLAADVRSYLPYDLLVKMDIASMANSLEARSPLLDHHVMEFCARLPERYKYRGRTSKYLLKKVGASLLPREVMHRRKMGFGVPLARWMRGEMRPLLEDTLFARQAFVRDYFDGAAVRRLVEDHQSRRQDYSFQLWALLCLEMWHQEFLSN